MTPAELEEVDRRDADDPGITVVGLAKEVGMPVDFDSAATGRGSISRLTDRRLRVGAAARRAGNQLQVRAFPKPQN